MSDLIDLENLRMNLKRKIATLQNEQRKCEDALKALDTVENCLSVDGQVQQILPGIHVDASDMGPTELVLEILNKQMRSMTMSDILAAAERYGVDLEKKYSKPYNVLYTAAKRLVRTGRIDGFKRNGKARYRSKQAENLSQNN